ALSVIICALDNYAGAVFLLDPVIVVVIAITVLESSACSILIDSRKPVVRVISIGERGPSLCHAQPVPYAVICVALVIGRHRICCACQAVQGIVKKCRCPGCIRLAGDIAQVVPDIAGIVDHRAVGAGVCEARKAVRVVPGICGLRSVTENPVKQPACPVIVVAHLKKGIVLLPYKTVGSIIGILHQYKCTCPLYSTNASTV